MDVIKVAVWRHTKYGYTRDGRHRGCGMDALIIRICVRLDDDH